MTRFHWFGDSWVVGAELELQVPSHQVKDYVFASLVSRHFEAECYNHGQSGISNNSLPLIFSNALIDINSAADTVFFCLTSSFRMSMLDDNNNSLIILPSINNAARRPSEHPNWKEWYKYFDTPPQRIYNYDCITSFLYHWCKNLGINCYFVNLFTTHSDTIIGSVPPDVWLLPVNQCLSQFILPVLDHEYGGIVTEDRASLTNTQWEIQKQAIEQYVRPCVCHPNIVGHEKMSQGLIDILDIKFNEIQ